MTNDIKLERRIYLLSTTQFILTKFDTNSVRHITLMIFKGHQDFRN